MHGRGLCFQNFDAWVVLQVVGFVCVLFFCRICCGCILLGSARVCYIYRPGSLLLQMDDSQRPLDRHGQKPADIVYAVGSTSGPLSGRFRYVSWFI
jgi:hypothetical protein